MSSSASSPVVTTIRRDGVPRRVLDSASSQARLRVAPDSVKRLTARVKEL
ncbi:hypothetical protein [Mycetohabitans endofungorum]|nr:hypothetical protein [Mycetohabitans endofungorum]